MSCMKTSVCTEPSIEIVNHNDEISSRCTVKVRRLLVFREEGTAYGGPLGHLIFAPKPRPLRPGHTDQNRERSKT